MPLVSIGLPVYNGENFLEESISSILNQTFKNFELIISDNASTDQTHSICQDFVNEDNRVFYYRNEDNLGAAYNFNKTFILSKGKYFKWSTYDDVLSPSNIEKCVDVLESQDNIVLCYPKSILIDEHGTFIEHYNDNLNLYHEKVTLRFRHFCKSINLANPVFGLIRSDALKNTNLINSFLAADYVLLVELLLMGNFYEIDEHLFYRRDHDLNTRKLTLIDQVLWYDPNKFKIENPGRRLYLEMLKSIHKSELYSTTKFMCYIESLNWIYRKFRAKGGIYKKFLKTKFILKSQ